MRPMTSEQWSVHSTGNMTVALLCADGQQVLAVDLLRSGAMKAGDNGQAPAWTKNNLTMLAMIPQLAAGQGLTMALPDPAPGCSPSRGGWGSTRTVARW